MQSVEFDVYGANKTDYTFQVQTTAGIYGGTDTTFLVELVSEVFSGVPGVGAPSYGGQGSTAKATIQHQQLEIELTDAEYETPIDIVANTGVTVKAGETVTLTARDSAGAEVPVFVEFAGQRRGDPKLQSRQQRQPVNPPCHGRAGGEHYIRVRRRRKRFCRCVIGEHDRERGDFRFGAERDGHGNAASNRRGSRQDVSVSPRDVRNQACSG